MMKVISHFQSDEQERKNSFNNVVILYINQKLAEYSVKKQPKTNK